MAEMHALGSAVPDVETSTEVVVWLPGFVMSEGWTVFDPVWIR